MPTLDALWDAYAHDEAALNARVAFPDWVRQLAQQAEQCSIGKWTDGVITLEAHVHSCMLGEKHPGRHVCSCGSLRFQPSEGA